MPGAKHSIPADYGATLKIIKQRVLRERVRVVLAANSAMVLLYWDIGRLILERQAGEGWGAKVIDRLARDLRQELSRYERILDPQSALHAPIRRRISGRSNCETACFTIALGACGPAHPERERPEAREWYMSEAIRQGWSRSVLEMQLLGNAFQRRGKAITNFETALPLAESRRAAEVFKDPYLFDFLGNTDIVRERQVEQALVEHIQRFILELGSGFAFVGRQVRLPVGDEEFFLDLFYHLKFVASS